MLIYVGNKVYSSADKVIMIEFEGDDLAHLKSSPDKARRFAAFPLDKMTGDDAVKEMDRMKKRNGSIFNLFRK